MFKPRLFALTALAALFAGQAMAEENPWLVRGRVIAVTPDDSASLSVGGAGLSGTSDIEDQFVPELDITYFFNENWAAELILATTPHDVAVTGVTVPGALTDATIDLGDVWLLPPTLTLQYHFKNESNWTPYVGAGVNFTLFYNEDEGPVADNIDYDESFGYALQAGLDYDFDGEPGGWLFNVDVKKVWLSTDVTVDFTTALGAGAIVDADVDIDPVIVGVGFGYKF